MSKGLVDFDTYAPRGGEGRLHPEDAEQDDGKDADMPGVTPQDVDSDGADENFQEEETHKCKTVRVKRSTRFRKIGDNPNGDR